VSPPETFDLASIEAFTAELVAAGYEPVPGTDRARWTGPIHPAFAELTDATRMTVAIRDGWPYTFPVLFVDGLHTNHVARWGFVCLWDEGDGSLEWLTLDGVTARIEQWCHNATHGWDSRGLSRDAHLNFKDKDHAVATLDLDQFTALGEGGWSEFHGTVQHPFHISFQTAPSSTEVRLAGLVFDLGETDVPPRDLEETLAALNGSQRRALRRELKARRRPDPHRPSGGADLVLLHWRRTTVEHLLALSIEGTGDDVTLRAMQPGPTDHESLLTRAGPDGPALRERRVAQFGAGALGGHLAVDLACSGLGFLRLIDDDQMLPGNVVRHAAGHHSVGIPKVIAVQHLIEDRAPWTEVDAVIEGPRTPSRMVELMADVDLVIDATGSEAATLALSTAAVQAGVPVVSGALYRGGAVAKVTREGIAGDVPLAARGGDPRYHLIPPGSDDEDLVEPAVGCSAPINNAPPSCVLAGSALLCQVTTDALTGRLDFPDEVIDVYRVLRDEPPYDHLGRLR
jgi:molybdopterin/thiamine biosynthesis adenylyltransferase